MPDVKLRLSDEELAAIDAARGDVPRERWIRRLCADGAVAAGTALPEGAGRVVDVPQAGSMLPDDLPEYLRPGH